MNIKGKIIFSFLIYASMFNNVLLNDNFYNIEKESEALPPKEYFIEKIFYKYSNETDKNNTSFIYLEGKYFMKK